MKICRFDDDRLGLVEGDRVRDVSAALEVLPTARWPLPPGDPLIANLDAVIARIGEIAGGAEALALDGVALKSPVANPGKIVGAPINYSKHHDEAAKDKTIAFGRDVKSMSIGDMGLFLKATSALVGPAEGVTIRFPDSRNDHEVELAAIIGKTGSRIRREDALDHIAGYAIGLDMTVRGPHVPSFRKSVDSYAVLGPWLVTRDEIADPNNLDLSISVGGQLRQDSNTSYMIYDVERLIEFASEYYTLYPGDIIMTGTPEGVGPVSPGEVMHAEIEGIGAMDVAVHGPEHVPG